MTALGEQGLVVTLSKMQLLGRLISYFFLKAPQHLCSL